MQNPAGATEHISILLLFKQSRYKGYCGQEGECKCSFDKQPDESITAFTDRKGQQNRHCYTEWLLQHLSAWILNKSRKHHMMYLKLHFSILQKKKYLLKITLFKATLNMSFCKKGTWNCLSTNQQMPFLKLTGAFWHYCNNHEYFIAKGRINCFNQFLPSLMKYTDNFLIYVLQWQKMCKFSILRQSWLSVCFPFDKNKHSAYKVTVLSQE